MMSKEEAIDLLEKLKQKNPGKVAEIEKLIKHLRENE